MPGARRTRSLACKMKKAHERSRHRFARTTRHSLRNGFNGLFRALPGDRALLPPSSADVAANLTPASGCQDHTTSPYASAPFVIGASASTASRPASVTIANRPSVRRDDGGYRLICTSEKQKYFCKGAGHPGKSPISPADLPVRQSIHLKRVRKAANAPAALHSPQAAPPALRQVRSAAGAGWRSRR